MLKHRLIAGSMMAAAIAAVLFGDAVISDRLGYPFYPFLFVFVLAAGYASVRELVGIIAEPNRPLWWVCVIGVLALLGSHFGQAAAHRTAGFGWVSPQSWQLPAYAFGGFVLFAFLVEMYRYRATGHSVAKIAHALLVVAYLGVLPSFFLKLRWLRFDDPDHPGRLLPDTTGLMLALTIFVPKCQDIAAYFVGRLLGRNKLTPLLSPKKTWEGFFGGFAGSVLAAWLLSLLGPVFRHGWVEAVAFGVAIGFAGVLGDLAESLIKRDGKAKDASQAVPGFGGLLDVFDSVIFAGPVAYLWFSVQN
jgi:phosphatidate cytidylyltransferase